MEQLCKCGHTLDAHTGMIDPATEELVEPYPIPCTECECEGFEGA